MVAEEKTESRYEGYVCPSCRMLFATDLSQVGTCVACPGCEQPVRIPLEGEAEDVLRLRSSRRYIQAGGAIAHDKTDRMSGNRDRQWDREDAEVEDLSEKQSLPWVWIVPTFLLGLCLVGVMISMIFGAKPVAPVERVPEETVATADDKPERVESDSVVGYEEDKHSELLEESLEGFLSATSVEELLPLIRKTDGVEEKVRGYYADRGFEKKTFKKLLSSSGVLSNPTMAAFKVRVDDFTTREGYGQLSDGKMLIDWETFVVYSSMPWDEMVEKKPTEAMEMWAIATPSNYYNFGFTDDKWQAYELVSPMEDRSLYGYVERNSAGRARLTSFGDSSSGVRCVLKIRYQEDSVASNQVVIEEVVENEWLLEIKEEK